MEIVRKFLNRQKPIETEKPPKSLEQLIKDYQGQILLANIMRARFGEVSTNFLESLKNDETEIIENITDPF